MFVWQSPIKPKLTFICLIIYLVYDFKPREEGGGVGGEALPNNRLVGMDATGWHFHARIDYNKVTFPIFEILGVRKFW